MTYQLSPSDLTAFNNYYTAGNYPAMYNLVANAIVANSGSVDAGVVAWFKSAARINGDDGSFISEYVRNYTIASAAAKGTPITEQDFQDASDSLAGKIHTLINSTSGTIPSAENIVETEVQTVVVQELGLDDDDWAGTLLAIKFFGFDAVEAFVQNNEEFYEQAVRSILIGSATVISNPTFILNIISQYGDAILASSPLVFDLDDSGTIELKSLASSTTYWDI